MQIIRKHPLRESVSKNQSFVSLRAPHLLLSNPASRCRCQSHKSVTFLNSSAYVTCPQGHVTHSFLACDLESACWGRHQSSCHAPLMPQPPSFLCTNGLQNVPLTLVCDFRSDCSDNSDENFCDHFPCHLATEFECRNKQCVTFSKKCDNYPDCLDSSDEDRCETELPFYEKKWAVQGPALVKFLALEEDLYQFVLTPYTPPARNSSSTWSFCPDTYFHCRSANYCLPVYLRCNGVWDCPGHEDEVDCQSYTCPGLYRCRQSSVCLSDKEMCDGFYQCPEYDDELFCNLTCPHACTCHGLAAFCSWPVPNLSTYPHLRFLDATGSGVQTENVSNNSMLVSLIMSRCGLQQLTTLDLPNLHRLDVSHNNRSTVSLSQLSLMPNLRDLSITDNPLTSLFSLHNELSGDLFQTLQTLDLTRVAMPYFKMTVVRMFPNLRVLNLSDSSIDKLEDDLSSDYPHLAVLDLTGCPLTVFPSDLFRRLQSLDTLWADNYKLCCPDLLPPRFNLANCQAPSDEISSCENLLRSDIYRGFLALISGLALLGNLVTFVVRIIVNRAKNGFEILTVTLCLSDFLMGVYLAVIGVADRLYMGSYLWQDVAWRHSAVCKMAGFLSMVSNEVSSLLVCLITFDRLILLRFPLSGVRFTRKGALVASACVWVTGGIFAFIPLVPATAHWQFYSINSICVPLPITRTSFAGHNYAFSLLIVFNFVLFVLIALGQLLIYWSVQKNSFRGSANQDNQRSAKDIKLAKRLATIAVTDFLCWFPIGLLGLLASKGTPIPSEVNVAMAIFVLPLNSAINPFLYTLNMLLEKRQAEKEQRLKQFLWRQIKQQQDAEKIISQ